jgi:hypothetical protein
VRRPDVTGTYRLIEYMGLKPPLNLLHDYLPPSADESKLSFVEWFLNSYT